MWVFGSGEEPCVSSCTGGQERVFPAKGAVAVQLRWSQCQTPAGLPLQRLPPRPGGAVQGLPLSFHHRPLKMSVVNWGQSRAESPDRWYQQVHGNCWTEVIDVKLEDASEEVSSLLVTLIQSKTLPPYGLLMASEMLTLMFTIFGVDLKEFGWRWLQGRTAGAENKCKIQFWVCGRYVMRARL